MIFDIEQGRPAIAADKNVAGLSGVGEFLAGAESGPVKQPDDVNGSFNCGKAMIGDDEDVGGITNVVSISAPRTVAKFSSTALMAAIASGEPGAKLCWERSGSLSHSNESSGTPLRQSTSVKARVV